MNCFERNACRAIKKSWGSYVGAACIIALGIFVYVSMMDTLNNLSGQVEAYYEQSHLADLFAVVSVMPEEQLKELEEIPGVETAFGRLSQDVRVLTEDGDHFVSVHLLARDSGDRLNCITVDGADADGKDAPSIWIGSRMMVAYGWTQGQKLCLLIEGSAVEFTVAGSCGAPDYVYSVPPSGAMIPDGALYDVAAISKERFEELFSRKGQVNEIGIALHSGTSSDEVRYAVREQLEPYGLEQLNDRKDQTSWNMVDGEISELISIGTVLPLIFLSISVFMLYTVLKKIIDQDRSLIGTMKAMGYEDGKLILAYLKQGVLIGLLGAVAGSILAIPFGKFMFEMYGEFFNLPDTVFHSYIGTRIQAAALAVGVSLGAVYLGVRGILRILPAEAMRAAAPNPVRHSVRLDRAIRNLKIMEKLGARAVSRSPFRTLLIALAVAFPFGMSCVLMSFQGVAEQMYYDEFDQIQTYDSSASLERPASLVDAKNAGLELDGVSEAEAVCALPLELKHENSQTFVLLHGLHPGSDLYRIRDIDGIYYEPPSDGVILNRRTASDLHVRKGDVVEALNTAISAHSVELKVTEIIEQSMGSGCYMDIESMRNFFSMDSLADTILLKTEAGSEGKVREQLLGAGGVTGLAEPKRIVESYRSMMGSMMAMMNLFSLMAVLTGVILIYNISLISIRERRVEFGTLLILGSSGRELGRMVWFEQTVYFLMGILAGIPMAYGFKKLVEEILVSDTYTIHMAIRPEAYLKAFVICLAIVIVSGISVRRTIGKIAPTDILKERE